MTRERLYRVNVLLGAALVTLYLAGGSRVVETLAQPAAEPIPRWDPVRIQRIADQMRREEAGIRIPAGYVFWKEVTVARVTAYDPSERCCAPYADGKTSLNDNAWILDGVAVDPRAIPYRTLVWIPGVGLREADGTGSAMRESWDRGMVHIDLRLATYREARKWGVQYLPLRLYRKSGG